MRQNFSLDRLIDYQTEPLAETTRVVNPDWRKLDAQVRTKVGFGAAQAVPIREAATAR
jgi:hypothetical protein